MTSVLSAISGQFSKSLILGTFFPVVAFLCGWIIFVSPLLPSDWAFLKPIEAFDTQWRIVVISLAAIISSGILYNLNIPILRFYEGYPWKDSWIGKRRIDHYKRELESADGRRRGMRTLLRALDPTDDRYQEISPFWNAIAQRINREFPRDSALILPTRLGNAIRSFEHYSDVQYDMDAIVMWPRIIAKIDKEYATSIDDSKTSFGFMLNSSALSGALAASVFLTGVLWSPGPLITLDLWIPWLLQIVAFAALARAFYWGAVSRAVAWGDMVKSAFDLYRWALLDQLKQTRVLTTMDEERQLWSNISLQILYGDSPAGARIDYAGATSSTVRTFARGNPRTVPLATVRGVGVPAQDGVVDVSLRIRNVGSKPSTNVTVTDTLPDGFEYVWGTASVNHKSPGRGVDVIGVNPYQFAVGDLEPSQEALLGYRMSPRKK